MNPAITTTFIACLVLAAFVAAGAGYAAAWWNMRGKLRAALGKIEHGAKMRQQTTAMLLQARRQVDTLTKELEAARKLRAIPRPAMAPIPAPAPVQVRGPSGGVVDGSSFADTVMPVQFADTQPYQVTGPAPLSAGGRA